MVRAWTETISRCQKICIFYSHSLYNFLIINPLKISYFEILQACKNRFLFQIYNLIYFVCYFSKVGTSACELEDQHSVVIEDRADRKLEDEKTDIPDLDRRALDKVIYTPGEISATIEKVSFVIFTLITSMFTFAILVIITCT